MYSSMFRGIPPLSRTSRLATSYTSSSPPANLAFARLLRTKRTYASVSADPPLLQRSPGEIARRVACTQMMLTRWGIEAAHASNGKDEGTICFTICFGSTDDRLILFTTAGRIETSYQALARAIDESKLDRSFTPQESKLMEKTLGTWSPQEDIVGTLGRWESFGILLWMLRIVDGVPRYHMPFPREVLYEATAIVPAFPTTVATFLEYFTNGEGAKESHRVTEDELRTAINKAEAWYWRARAQVVLDLRESLKGDSEEQKAARKKIPSALHTVMSNLDSALTQASIRATTDHLIDETISVTQPGSPEMTDFGVDGTPYRALDDHALREANDIAEYRLAALGWLTGREWDFQRGEVPFIHPLGSLWTPVDN
ncbi:uncharacterized protein EV422DRAFT_623603 [Fimicolochytrium jonesii]|uniref:uncharacterized protein n=1 Tax=Fimicolochytrium jonesii TaxID=1396493 RepID=UPI0022FE20C3|nr:uncharacterized protein EV422DRAFT_623603 [Fimicolochytrium jonesii]KAI8816240.1 hypothetical protein EV422DRAFT_623603 [Fimicolochytrium jonesii]